MIAPAPAPAPAPSHAPPEFAPKRREAPQKVRRATPPTAESPARSATDFERANRAHFVDHDYALAVELWGAYLEHPTSEPSADEARFNQLVGLFKLGRLGDARGKADEALRLSPSSPHRDEIEKLGCLIDDSAVRRP